MTDIDFHSRYIYTRFITSKLLHLFSGRHFNVIFDNRLLKKISTTRLEYALVADLKLNLLFRSISILV